MRDGITTLHSVEHSAKISTGIGVRFRVGDMSTDELPGNDAELKEALAKLFLEWEEKLKRRFKEELKEIFKNEPENQEFKFLRDGVVPGYSEQELKILFIALEAHSGTRSIVDHVVGVRDSSLPAFPTEAHRKDGSTRGRSCWSRALRITYGLLRGVEKWDDIPKTDYFRKTFKKPGDISFAIVEASKYANPQKKNLSDIFANCAYESLGGKEPPLRNFTREEIEILNPDLIISWNLRKAFKTDKNGNKDNGDCFLRELTMSGRPDEEPSENIRIWTYTFNERQDASTGKIKQIKLLDTWHLAAHKSPRRDIYPSIRDAVKKLISEGKLKVKKS